MMMALMTNKNKPRVMMVMGRVSTIKIGFTKKFNMLSTKATIMAVTIESTPTPGSRYERIITAKALRRSLKIIFMELR